MKKLEKLLPGMSAGEIEKIIDEMTLWSGARCRLALWLNVKSGRLELTSDDVEYTDPLVVRIDNFPAFTVDDALQSVEWYRFCKSAGIDFRKARQDDARRAEFISWYRAKFREDARKELEHDIDNIILIHAVLDRSDSTGTGKTWFGCTVVCETVHGPVQYLFGEADSWRDVSLYAITDPGEVDHIVHNAAMPAVIDGYLPRWDNFNEQLYKGDAQAIIDTARRAYQNWKESL